MSSLGWFESGGIKARWGHLALSQLDSLAVAIIEEKRWLGRLTLGTERIHRGEFRTLPRIQ